MNRSTRCALLGAPVQEGVGQKGCLMGPAAYRTAGLAEALSALGHVVTDLGDVAMSDPARWARPHPNDAVRHLPEIAAWTEALQRAVADAAATTDFPVILGGDHSLAMGAISALSAHAARDGAPLFLLWLDAHPDLHSLDSTVSGNLHGVPMSYLLGAPGFEGYLPPNPAPLAAERVCMMGVRSVDPPEHARLADCGVAAHDMRAIDEHGVVRLLRPFLERVRAAGGWLHVTLDVDFLDPEIAPGVNTTVPGGASYREAHLIMEMVHDSGLARSMDLVELNPYLDERGKTARLMVDLAASLLGRQVLGRPTAPF